MALCRSLRLVIVEHVQLETGKVARMLLLLLVGRGCDDYITLSSTCLESEAQNVDETGLKSIQYEGTRCDPSALVWLFANGKTG